MLGIIISQFHFSITAPHLHPDVSGRCCSSQKVKFFCCCFLNKVEVKEEESSEVRGTLSPKRKLPIALSHHDLLHISANCLVHPRRRATPIRSLPWLINQAAGKHSYLMLFEDVWHRFPPLISSASWLLINRVASYAVISKKNACVMPTTKWFAKAYSIYY